MDFRNLYAYQKSFELAMEIFELSKIFPKEEKYSLTDQVRRSSRSVCGNIAEAYRKRIYPNHFISKLTDSDAENSETNVWLEFALKCDYISKDSYDALLLKNIEIGKLINYMVSNPQKFGCVVGHSPKTETETEN
ncbi:four helix bundle protein [Flavobacterium pallidum]|uniref:Diversity-generating retroelement protein bAvd family protein n=1 Tax=Flavobacterium pallidum TaxID=2172098 RepID=A0A2S1SGX9_9FLAO|nr:four helix bundle protein [Flavobacterium pallidum]AWI25635.1 diversity-generating retroelement protein bAvd family protein [Flavobacterium pallidum]